MANKRKTELRKAGYKFLCLISKPRLRRWKQVINLSLSSVPREEIAQRVGYKATATITALHRNPQFIALAIKYNYMNLEAIYRAYGKPTPDASRELVTLSNCPDQDVVLGTVASDLKELLEPDKTNRV